MKKIIFGGFAMSETQKNELRKSLQENILFRYDNSEYWDMDILANFAHDHKLKSA